MYLDIVIESQDLFATHLSLVRRGGLRRVIGGHHATLPTGTSVSNPLGNGPPLWCSGEARSRGRQRGGIIMTENTFDAFSAVAIDEELAGTIVVVFASFTTFTLSS